MGDGHVIRHRCSAHEIFRLCARHESQWYSGRRAVQLTFDGAAPGSWNALIGAGLIAVGVPVYLLWRRAPASMLPRE
jgi:hypothetical protein